MSQFTLGVTNNNQPIAAELEQAVESAKKLEGLVDFVLIRVDQHPNAWTQDKGRPRSLAYAEAIKKAGIKHLVCHAAGFHDEVLNDEFIASGKCDIIEIIIPFFSDPELVKKAS